MIRQAYRFLVVFALLIAVGCSRGLSPEDAKLVESLKAEQQSVQKEIAAATIEADKYQGGLILSLITARLETLKSTEALIGQRIHAVESGAPITVQIPVSKPDPERAAELEKEIATQSAALAAAEAEASKYSGGLIHAMALSTVATHAQSLAMLRQSYVAAKFGLAVPALGEVAAKSPDADLRPSGTIEPAASPSLASEIVTVNLKRKWFDDSDFQKFVFFDIEFVGKGLDKPTRAIKGTLNINDLFGEKKLGIGWTIDQPMQPGGVVAEKGTGFEYNQFKSDHQWVNANKLSDMGATFVVKSILYTDGTRVDLD
jgi:hypothetical protein